MDCKTRSRIIMKVTCYKCTNVLYKTEYLCHLIILCLVNFYIDFYYVDENLKIIF